MWQNRLARHAASMSSRPPGAKGATACASVSSRRPPIATGTEPRRPGSHHGTAFASTFNGFDESEVRKYDWTFVRARKRIKGARVVKVWDQERVWARRLAAACNIPTVCRHAGSMRRRRRPGDPRRRRVGRAFQVRDPSLENRNPHVLRQTAGHERPRRQSGGGRGSRDRDSVHVGQFSEVRSGYPAAESAELPELGPVYLAQAVCANELIYYGIHALSMIYAVLGGGAVSAVNVGQPGLNVVRIRFADHRDVVLMVGERQWMRSGYQISLFGKTGLAHGEARSERPLLAPAAMRSWTTSRTGVRSRCPSRRRSKSSRRWKRASARWPGRKRSRCRACFS